MNTWLTLAITIGIALTTNAAFATARWHRRRNRRTPR